MEPNDDQIYVDTDCLPEEAICLNQNLNNNNDSSISSMKNLKNLIAGPTQNCPMMTSIPMTPNKEQTRTNCINSIHNHDSTISTTTTTNNNIGDDHNNDNNNSTTTHQQTNVQCCNSDSNLVDSNDDNRLKLENVRLLDFTGIKPFYSSYSPIQTVDNLINNINNNTNVSITNTPVAATTAAATPIQSNDSNNKVVDQEAISDKISNKSADIIVNNNNNNTNISSNNSSSCKNIGKTIANSCGDASSIVQSGNFLMDSMMYDTNLIVIKWLIHLVESGHVQTVCTALLVLGSERLRLNQWLNEAVLENWFTAYLDLLSRFRLWTISARIIKQCGIPTSTSSNHLEFRRTLDKPANSLIHIHSNLNNEPVGHGLDSLQSVGLPSMTGPNSTSSEYSRYQRWKNSTTPTPHSAYVCSGAGSGGGNSNDILVPNIAALNQASTVISIRCGLCAKPFFANESTQRQTKHAGWACSRHTTTADPITATCALCHLTVRGLFVWCRGCSHGGHLEHIQAWLSQRTECPAGCGHRCRWD